MNNNQSNNGYKPFVSNVDDIVESSKQTIIIDSLDSHHNTNDGIVDNSKKTIAVVDMNIVDTKTATNTNSKICTNIESASLDSWIAKVHTLLAQHINTKDDKDNNEELDVFPASSLHISSSNSKVSSKIKATTTTTSAKSIDGIGNKQYDSFLLKSNDNDSRKDDRSQPTFMIVDTPEDITNTTVLSTTKSMPTSILPEEQNDDLDSIMKRIQELVYIELPIAWEQEKMKIQNSCTIMSEQHEQSMIPSTAIKNTFTSNRSSKSSSSRTSVYINNANCNNNENEIDNTIDKECSKIDSCYDDNDEHIVVQLLQKISKVISSYDDIHNQVLSNHSKITKKSMKKKNKKKNNNNTSKTKATIIESSKTSKSPSSSQLLGRIEFQASIRLVLVTLASEIFINHYHNIMNLETSKTRTHGKLKKIEKKQSKHPKKQLQREHDQSPGKEKANVSENGNGDLTTTRMNAISTDISKILGLGPFLLPPETTFVSFLNRTLHTATTTTTKIKSHKYHNSSSSTTETNTFTAEVECKGNNEKLCRSIIERLYQEFELPCPSECNGSTNARIIDAVHTSKQHGDIQLELSPLVVNKRKSRKKIAADDSISEHSFNGTIQQILPGEDCKHTKEDISKVEEPVKPPESPLIPQSFKLTACLPVSVSAGTSKQGKNSKLQKVPHWNNRNNATQNERKKNTLLGAQGSRSQFVGSHFNTNLSNASSLFREVQVIVPSSTVSKNGKRTLKDDTKSHQPPIEGRLLKIDHMTKPKSIQSNDVHDKENRSTLQNNSKMDNYDVSQRHNLYNKSSRNNGSNSQRIMSELQGNMNLRMDSAETGRTTTYNHRRFSLPAGTYTGLSGSNRNVDDRRETKIHRREQRSTGTGAVPNQHPTKKRLFPASVDETPQKMRPQQLPPKSYQQQEPSVQPKRRRSMAMMAIVPTTAGAASLTSPFPTKRMDEEESPPFDSQDLVAQAMRAVQRRKDNNRLHSEQ